MTVQTILPRGIRNNNPLNIRLSPKTAGRDDCRRG